MFKLWTNEFSYGKVSILFAVLRDYRFSKPLEVSYRIYTLLVFDILHWIAS